LSRGYALSISLSLELASIFYDAFLVFFFVQDSGQLKLRFASLGGIFAFFSRTFGK